MLRFIFVSYKSDHHVERIRKLELWEKYSQNATFTILRVGEAAETLEPLSGNVVVTTEANPGYMQAVIDYVKKHEECDDGFIVVANIDIEFGERDFNLFLKWIKKIELEGEGCSIAAPMLINEVGEHQNPFWRKKRGRLFWVKQQILYSSYQIFSIYNWIKNFSKIRKTVDVRLDCETVFAVHGCFFAIRKSLLCSLPEGFPPLWAEEVLLGCEAAFRGKTAIVNHSICFKHLESPSTSRFNFAEKAKLLSYVRRYLVRNYWAKDSLLKSLFGKSHTL